ncbi:MAG: hypothetical protein AB7S86_16575 [Hydrogenophaga sp.]|uniref:hypothetical protein n=1 Tax=Hydrogenophaga sp. TaxID=1904254 RepID=UPI003D0E033B
MTHAARRWAIAAAALVALLAAAWLALVAIVPSDEQLARRLEAEFEERMGQKLVVGSVRWRVMGLPMIELLDASTLQQPEAIRVRRVAIYPELMPLLQKRLVISRLLVEGALVPRNALAAYRGKAQGGEGAVLVRAVEFTDSTYIAYNGIPVVYEGEIRFDNDRLPQRLALRRPDARPPASLEATRDGTTDTGAHLYRLRLQAAGGSAQGQARLTQSAKGRMALVGELAPRGVDLQALLDTFHRRSPIGGLASGETQLQAEGNTATELFRSLHSRSVLTVERASILRFNLDQAIKSLGEDRAGETPLDSLSGVMDTQNTEHGLKTVFTDVKAVAGHYAATGQATLYRGQIDAQGELEIGGGIVDVPFSAHGPTGQPTFNLAWGAVAGAAVGTAVLPGIGTVIGAKIGGAVSEPPRPDKGEAPPQRPRR